ncbi:class I SAM-dependent methyltransferase [Oceanimonas baumannii]|uniref:Methyltransferase family protein n=1 Tax=Oceanimonas baumannii TaxID=129578 RepID=A0ABY2EY84_9GAMM|nr:class I SAM-dependent methyltransferase [Oceanimonas baumannii]TDW58774.1 methyltransferase family protein [Oceanimonas baumannii]
MLLNEWNGVAASVNFNLDILVGEYAAVVSGQARVLDFGCGYGRITEQLYHSGFENIVGVDSSEQMIARGREDFPYLDLRHYTGQVLPFQNNEFDAVVACAVFTCITDTPSREKTIKELWRVLQPGGTLYLAEFCSEQSIRFTSGFGIAMWHSREQELHDMLDGFDIMLSRVTDASTISGQAGEACHLIARKRS